MASLSLQRTRRTRQSDARELVLAVILALAAGAGVAAFSSRISLPEPVLLGVGALVITAAPIATRVLNGRFDLFEPIFPACIMLGLLFGVRPIASVITNETVYHDTYLIEPHLARASLLGVIGTFAFVAAYELGASRRNRVRNDVRYRASLEIAYGYGLVLSVLGLALFGVYLAQTGSIVSGLQGEFAGRSEQLQALSDSSSEYLTSAPVTVACAGIVILIAAAPRMTRRQKLIVVLAVSIPVILMFAGGARRFIIPSVMIPVVAYYLIARRRPTLAQLAIPVAIAAIVLATIPFARGAFVREREGGLVSIFSEAFRQPLLPLEGFVTGVDTEMVPALAVELETLDRTGSYTLGKATVGDVLIAPIPGKLVHKPITANDELLIDAFRTRCDAVGGFCPTFSTVGTFYQDGWYVGVFLGMALLGFGSAAIWRSYLRAPDSPYRVLLAATWIVLLPILIRGGGPLFKIFFYFLVPAAIGIWLAFDRVRSQRDAAPADLTRP